MTPAITSPIHRAACSGDVAWSTMNAGEALPGVITPLTWTFFGDAVERAMKGTFYDMGVMTRREVLASPRAEDRLMDVFYGRAAGNLNVFRMIGDRTPGTSGDAIERQIFGQVRDGVTSRPQYGRYPFVAARMPWAAARLITNLGKAVDPVGPWWRRSVQPGALDSPAAARAALEEAAHRFEQVMRPHTLAAMLCQALYDQLRKLAEQAGRPGLELRLVTGYGDMAETAVVTDLWDVSRDALSLEEFIARHGFHGPGEGELSSKVWRLRTEPLEGLLRSYRELGPERDPRHIERERAAERERAEAELLAALPRRRRAGARLVMRLAARFVPLRGTGKAAFLRCMDVARAGALCLGEEMQRDGLLADAEDVFMLTLAELESATPPADARELADERRAQREEFLRLDIPDLFYGVPEPSEIAAPTAAAGDGPITGAAVSPGLVEGLARLVLDPNDDEPLEPGEILVCRTTDPSWASTMMLASALVIDIGGPISHGAIFAREVGIPCVIGTRDATARIKTGDRLRVDGARGQVAVLTRTERNR